MQMSSGQRSKKSSNGKETNVNQVSDSNPKTEPDAFSDHIHFKVTPEKKCCLSRNHGECKKFSDQDLACSCCPKGFHGRPLNFEYTPISDAVTRVQNPYTFFTEPKLDLACPWNQ